MHRSSPAKGLSFMDKSVPKNKKFAHIQSKLDTGATIDKVKFVTARECSRRRNEIFYRIKREHLYDLFEEYEQDEYESINETDNRLGNGPRIVTHTNNAQPNYNKPYLILDVRDKEDFNKCHLLQARNFPYALLRRDQIHPEVYKFKNVPETLIILYCDDERISSEAAKVFVDRGTDNIFLLTGGMNEFAADFPAFVEGDLPPTSPTKGGSSGLSRISEDHASPGNKMHALKSECDYSMGGRKGPPLTGRSRNGGSQGGLSRGDLTDRSDKSYRSNAGSRFRDDVSESGFSTRYIKKLKIYLITLI